jgi:hypothetical protein
MTPGPPAAPLFAHPMGKISDARTIGRIRATSTITVGGSATGGERSPVCDAGGGGTAVQAPQFVHNIPGQISWFASPVVADLDGDGLLEIMIQTFDHGMDIFTVPGSGGNCLLWIPARGGPLRMGQPGAVE